VLLAITKQRKDQLVSEYVELIEQSRAIFLADYMGLSVKEMETLRDKVREVNGQISVTKNTLLRIALEQSDREIPDDLLVGQTATGFALGEAPALAKILVEQAKSNEKLALRGAIIGDRVLTAAEVEQLSKLPSLEQLRAQILGLIGTPAQGIASALSNGVRQVVNVLDAYSKTEEAVADAAG
jgi:large subunit ribosomal protein L10